MKIYKYPLKVLGETVIHIPFNYKILCVQVQKQDDKEIPCLWAMVNEKGVEVPLYLETFGTGQPIPNDFEGKYIGTYQLYDGDLVHHVFEV